MKNDTNLNKKNCILASHDRDYLSRYMELTESVENKIAQHMHRYQMNTVCAWYRDWEDFCSDWCKIGYTRTEARKLFHGGIGEFMQLSNGNILRFSA